MTSKSALKRVVTDAKKHIANKSKKSEIFTTEKKFRAAVEAKDPSVETLGREMCSKLDKAAKTGTIHKNKASRKKSQIMSLVNSTK